MNSGADRPGCTVIGKAAFEDHTAFHVVDAGRGLYPAQHEITHEPGSQISLLRRVLIKNVLHKALLHVADSLAEQVAGNDAYLPIWATASASSTLNRALTLNAPEIRASSASVRLRRSASSCLS